MNKVKQRQYVTEKVSQEFPDAIVLGDLPALTSLAIYLVGSRLYGTAGPTSDFDYLAVVDKPVPNLYVYLRFDGADVGLLN
jgi:hypothetical protein